MAEVPMLQPSVPMQAPGAPDVSLQPITPVASGANIGEAVSGVGQTVEQQSSRLAKSMIYVQRQNAKIDAEEKFGAFAQKVQDASENARATKGRQAIGITAGAVPAGPYMGGGKAGLPDKQGYLPGDIKYKDSFMGQMDQAEKELMQSLSSHQQTILQRRIETLKRTHENAVFNHETQQRQVAMDDADNAAHATLLNSASSAVKPEDVQGMMNEGLSILRDQAIRKGRDLGNKNVSDEISRQNADQFVEHYVKSNLEDHPDQAKNVLDKLGGQISGKLKNDLQSHVDGKYLHMTAATAWDQAAKDPQMQLPDGHVNMLEMQKVADQQFPEPAKNQQFMELIRHKENEADDILQKQNEGNTKAFHDLAAKPETSADEAKKVAAQYAKRLRNGEVDHEDLRQKTEFVNLVHQPLKGSEDPETYIALAHGVDNGTITDIAPLNEAFKASTLSKAHMQSLALRLNAGKSQAMNDTRNELIKNLPDTIADPVTRAQFIATVRDQEHQGNLTKPSDLIDLWNKNLETVKTGAERLRGLLPDKTDQYWTMAKAVGPNPEIIKYAQAHGGPDNFKVGTPQNNALDSLIKIQGFQAEQITPELLNKYLKKYPNGRPKS